MKVVSVKLNIPYRYGPDEVKKVDDDAKLRGFLEPRNLTMSDGQCIVCRAEHAVEAMVYFGVHKYNEVSIELVTELFDTVDETVDALHGVLSRLQIAAARVESQIATMLPDDASKPGYGAGIPGWNAKTASPISGPLLHSFNETMLCEDLCTDALQGYLNEGWRLIAVCPQESRRPDYVLARVFEQENNIPRSAARG